MVHKSLNRSPTLNFDTHDYSDFYYGSGDDPANLFAPYNTWYDDALPNGYYLFSEPMAGAPATEVQLISRKSGETRDLLNFASYNYLGLSYRDEVKRAAIAAIEKYGLGASGSPILSGTLDLHKTLERRIARFKNMPAALLFPTGYSANVGFISALMRPGDNIFLDQYCHASIVDGAILAKSKTVFFRHNNAADLEWKLAKASGKKLVVLEGVYSMDGDICDLPAIVAIAKKYGARVLIDEAHSAFIFGQNGRGIVEHFGLDNEIDFHLGTFSKSLGGQGGYVCGSREMVEYINAFARSRFFSCNLAPVITAGLIAALDVAEAEPELRDRLWSNVDYMRRKLLDAGLDIGDSQSQVIPVFIRNDKLVFTIVEKLQAQGLYLHPITYPAVAKHRSRLRLSISSSHTREQIDRAVEIIRKVLREEGLCP